MSGSIHDTYRLLEESAHSDDPWALRLLPIGCTLALVIPPSFEHYARTWEEQPPTRTREEEDYGAPDLRAPWRDTIRALTHQLAVDDRPRLIDLLLVRLRGSGDSAVLAAELIAQLGEPAPLTDLSEALYATGGLVQSLVLKMLAQVPDATSPPAVAAALERWVNERGISHVILSHYGVVDEAARMINAQGTPGRAHARRLFVELRARQRRGLPLEPLDEVITLSDPGARFRAFCGALGHVGPIDRGEPIDPALVMGLEGEEASWAESLLVDRLTTQNAARLVPALIALRSPLPYLHQSTAIAVSGVTEFLVFAWEAGWIIAMGALLAVAEGRYAGDRSLARKAIADAGLERIIAAFVAEGRGAVVSVALSSAWAASHGTRGHRSGGWVTDTELASEIREVLTGAVASALRST